MGKSAPWFILAIMLFSYAVCGLYIESCSMFVRGGVYRVVKEAMGSTLAKFSVSALMFDYILTGPKPRTSPGCLDRKSTRLNSSHQIISYAVFCLKKKKEHRTHALMYH